MRLKSGAKVAEKDGEWGVEKEEPADTVSFMDTDTSAETPERPLCKDSNDHSSRTK